MFQRARMRGYVMFVQEADRQAKRERQLYFGPSQPGMIPGLRDVIFELRWGASMIEFKPKITTANQVGVGDGPRLAPRHARSRSPGP